MAPEHLNRASDPIFITHFIAATFRIGGVSPVRDCLTNRAGQSSCRHAMGIERAGCRAEAT
jgi:hypothetical protein